MTPQAKRLTPEQLMQPRYEVIADYPEIERHNIRIGDIITTNESPMYADKTQDGTPVVAIDHEIFPAIFRRLNWWEHRTPEEMPEYVKVVGKTTHDIDGGSVWRFKKLISNNPYLHSIMVYDNPGEFWANTFLPATLQDYTQYITNLNANK